MQPRHHIVKERTKQTRLPPKASDMTVGVVKKNSEVEQGETEEKAAADK
jgi:hypothetical protein